MIAALKLGKMTYESDKEENASTKAGQQGITKARGSSENKGPTSRNSSTHIHAEKKLSVCVQQTYEARLYSIESFDKNSIGNFETKCLVGIHRKIHRQKYFMDEAKPMKSAENCRWLSVE